MDPVSYCCIWKGGRVLYTYTIGNHEMDNLAALCLEMIPPYHRCYFETIGHNTFSFFMDDGLVYFAIVCKSLGKSQVLRFLGKLRDEFGKRASTEQLFPVVHQLIASLQPAEEESTVSVWPAQNPSPSNNANGTSSTKAPLLGKARNHTIEMEEEHRRSLGPDDQGTSASPLHKDYTSSSSCSSSSSSSHGKWCRQVRIILAVDAAVCLVLFIIWLAICGGIACIH